VNGRSGSADYRVLNLLNIIGVLTVLVVNALANIVPIGGQTTGEISAKYPTLFTPAGFTFAIWGFIYLLMLIFAADQTLRFLYPKGDRITERIGWWFVLSCLANTTWIFAWHNERFTLSVVIMLVLLLSLITIYLRLGIGLEPARLRTQLAVHLLFRVYLGWISVATIVNISIWLISVGWDRWGLSELIWAIALVLVATTITLLMLRNRNDLVFALVIIWAFAGIIVERMRDPYPLWVLIGTLVVGIAVIALGSLTVLRSRRENSWPSWV